MELSTKRSQNLSNRLLLAIADTPFDPPSGDEKERSYTARCLTPIVQSVLDDLHIDGFRVRGDGVGQNAVPSRVLDADFFPDIAVSLGRQNVWAAEVKFLRSSGRQNSIATALGQATLYRSRYEHSAVVLIDLSEHADKSLEVLRAVTVATGVRFIVRSKLGNTLMKSSLK